MAKNPETKVTFRAFNQEFNKAIGEMKSESTKLRKEFQLQEEQLKQNGTEADRLTAKVDYLKRAQEIAQQQVAATEQQLAKAKATFGENSVEVEKLTNKLLDAQIAEQKLANQVSTTEQSLSKLAQQTSSTTQALNELGTEEQQLLSQLSKVNAEYELQKAKLGANASEADQLSLKMSKLSEEHRIAGQQVQNLEKQLELAKQTYGENSTEADKLAQKLLNVQIAEQKLANQMTATVEAQNKNAEATKQLRNLFVATETEVVDYAHALGNELVHAINTGTASSKQLETALEKIGQEALGASVDLDKMKKALSHADDGASLNAIKKDLGEIAKEAKTAEQSVSDLGGELESIAGALVAGGGLAGAVQTALDTSTLNTKIDITFEVPKESIASVKTAVKQIEAYGVDGEAALEGVRRQWALNKNASDEVNTAVVRGAATIAASYSGIDFTELIQETNEIGNELKISNEEALGLTNSLLKMGFPPEQLDIIAEYGQQLQRAGYDATEIQAIMAAGVETGTWNIDNLLDGLKEGRIRVAEFGEEVPKALSDLLEGTNISAKQMQEWGQAVANGGEGGSKAMQQIATALQGVDDETKKNALGVQIFGTMYEDQGQHIIDTLLNAKDATVDLKANQDQLNDATSKWDASPAIQMQQALSNLKIALEPLLGVIATLLSKVAEWISNNPTLAATITAIVTAIGILVGICMALAPIFVTLTGAAAALGVSVGAIAAPIAIAVAVIAGLIAAGIAIYKNWDKISAKAGELAQVIGEKFEEFKAAIGEKMASAETKIKEIWGKVEEFFGNIDIKEVGKKIIKTMVDGFTEMITPVLTKVTELWTKSLTFLKGINIVESGKSIFSTFINGIGAKITETKNKVVELWNGALNFIKGINITENAKSIFNTFISGVGAKIADTKNKVVSLWNDSLSFIKGINISENAKTIFGTFVSGIGAKISAVRSKVVELWTQAKSYLTGINLTQTGKDVIQGLINGIRSKIGAIKDAVKDAASAITGKIKSILQIKSPSRVLMKIGKWAGEGLANGMEKTKNMVSSTAGMLAERAIPNVQIGDQLANAKQQMMANGLEMSVANNQPIHITVVSELDGYEVARNQYPYINDMQGDDTNGLMYMKGMRR